MAKYQKYAEYKDSGVEWLGDIPSHWELKSTKNIFKIINGATPKSGVENFWDGKIIWITPSDLSKLKSDKISNSSRYITKHGFNSCGTSLVPENTIILSCRAPIGLLAIATEEVCTNQGCKSLVSHQKVDNKFIYYYLTISKVILNVLGRGTTFLELSSDELGNYKLPYPNKLAEQTQIANFLDYETAKIDTLIANQKKLIELLKEKRQAMISHAVTKGLDPNVKMKASGMEWLGDVPEHWSVIPLKHVVTTWKGVAFKAIDFCDDGVKVIKASDIKNKTIRDSAIYLPNNYLNIYSKYVLKTGDLILSTVGSAPDVKNSAVGQIGKVPAFLNGSFLNQNTVVFNAKAILDKNYLFFSVQNNRYRDHLDLNSHGTANQASLNVADMLDFSIAIPSISEQVTIAIFLDNQTQKIDSLISKAQLAIKLMQERRTALISSAVTGKIDVRDWQKPQEA